MTNKQILQADMLDILFEHRNKLYGAYALRKTYSTRLIIALGSALALVFAFILMSFINKKKDDGNGRSQHEEMFIIKNYEIPADKPKEPELPKEKPKQVNAQSDFQKIIVVPDDKADPPLPTTDDLAITDIGDKNILGKKSDDIVKPNDNSVGNGNGEVKKADEKPETFLPSRQPEFPGGTAAWLSFLQRYLQSPEGLEPGQRVEVQIRFWVDTDGSVSRPEIIKSGGASFDKEVLRVMKKMPRWQPALQHGNLIAVAYTQPVIFMGVEE